MILLLLLELTTVATFSLRKSRRKLLSSFSSSTHTSNQKRVEMMKKQKHPRPWWDETKFFANPSPSKGPSEKDLLVLADYYTAEGEYLGGHVPTLIYDGPETETSKCDQYYTVNAATRVLLTGEPAPSVNTTNLFCAAWSLDEISHDEKETGSCICKAVAPLAKPTYCAQWECSQTEQSMTPSCVSQRSSRSRYYSSYGSSYSNYYGGSGSGSSYSSHCYTRYEEETSEYICTEASASGNYCKKWHGMEMSGHTVEDERYVCLEADPGENYCTYFVGETASTEEAEQSESRCQSPSTNGLFCEHYSGTELGLSRYRNRTDAWLTAILWGTAGGLAGLVWLAVGIILSMAEDNCGMICGWIESRDDCGVCLSALILNVMMFAMLLAAPIVLLLGMMIMVVLVAGIVPLLVWFAIMTGALLCVGGCSLCVIISKKKHDNELDDFECHACASCANRVFCCRDDSWEESGWTKSWHCFKEHSTCRECKGPARPRPQRSNSVKLGDVPMMQGVTPCNKLGIFIGTQVRITGGAHTNEIAILAEDDGSSCPKFKIGGSQLYVSLATVTTDLTQSSMASTKVENEKKPHQLTRPSLRASDGIITAEPVIITVSGTIAHEHSLRISSATAKDILPILIPLGLARNAARLLADGYETPQDLERATEDDLVENTHLSRADAVTLVNSFVHTAVAVGVAWDCSSCTCANPAAVTICGVCGEPKL